MLTEYREDRESNQTLDPRPQTPFRPYPASFHDKVGQISHFDLFSVKARHYPDHITFIRGMDSFLNRSRKKHWATVTSSIAAPFMSPGSTSKVGDPSERLSRVLTCAKSYRINGRIEIMRGTPRHEVEKILERLPENVSLEEIQHHIYVKQKIERAIRAAESGETISHEEVEKQMSKWLDM
jgi:hypothetical protein